MTDVKKTPSDAPPARPASTLRSVWDRALKELPVRSVAICGLLAGGVAFLVAVAALIAALMTAGSVEAELTSPIGAAPGERTEDRLAQRNGHHPKLLTTPAGDVDIAIPKLRTGSFFPELLEPRRRFDRALWAVIMTAYVTGTSTRKVDDLVKALGCDSLVLKST